MKTTSNTRNSRTRSGTTALLATAFVLTVTSAYAQQNSRPSLDTDGDGYISESEYTGRVANRLGTFSEVDTDGDGKISKDELQARIKEKRAERDKQ